jgi:hypothetical protein
VAISILNSDAYANYRPSWTVARLRSRVSGPYVSAIKDA